MFRATYGNTLPSLNASTGFTGTAIGTDGFSDPASEFSLGLGASWEADLWGRLRTTTAASRADIVASEGDLAAAELAIAGETAFAWFELKEAVAQENLAVITLEIRERTRTITERRLAQGTASALDVRTARSAVFQAEAAIASRQLATGRSARRLEVLLGRYPKAEISALETFPTLGPLPAGGDPLLLLSRRPDLAAAEARVVAAGLRAEAARLALRPSLDLSGSIALGGENADELFDFDRMLTRLTGSLIQPIFNGGALDANADAALARARQALAGYTRSVLNAWQEVENAIQADTLLARQEEAQLLSLEEARLAEGIAERQYAEGTTTIFNLIDAQNRRLSAEGSVISIRAARVSNRVSYHLALGGGIAPSTSDSAGTSGGSSQP